jgi:hypothetical protein
MVIFSRYNKVCFLLLQNRVQFLEGARWDIVSFVWSHEEHWFLIKCNLVIDRIDDGNIECVAFVDLVCEVFCCARTETTRTNCTENDCCFNFGHLDSRKMIVTFRLWMNLYPNTDSESLNWEELTPLRNTEPIENGKIGKIPGLWIPQQSRR